MTDEIDGEIIDERELTRPAFWSGFRRGLAIGMLIFLVPQFFVNRQFLHTMRDQKQEIVWQNSALNESTAANRQATEIMQRQTAVIEQFRQNCKP